MTFLNALNSFLGPVLIIIIILADCRKRTAYDFFLKRNISFFLVITFISLTADFIFKLIINYTPDNSLLSKFFITDKNIRAVILFFPVISYLLIILFLRRYKKQRFILFSVSLFLNIITDSSIFFWSLITAILLFDYLFIIFKESKIDYLTGLNNRYSFYEYFSKLSRGKTGESWNISMIDVINFKTINNIYGYLEGDEVLRKLADEIKKYSDKLDFTARYGGDEFVYVSKEADTADEIMSGILNNLEIFNKTSNKPYSIEIGYGTDVFTADGKTEIDCFLNNLSTHILKQNDGNRRAGDYIS